MFEKIVEFFSTNNGMQVLGFIVTIFVAYFTARYTAANTKKSITTQIFKENGAEAQKKVLNFWSTLNFNNFNIQDAYDKSINQSDKKSSMDSQQILLEVLKDSYVYCSPATIRAIRYYMQSVYRRNKNENKMKDNKKNNDETKFSKTIGFCRNYVLISRILSRMKYDFTGEKVDELDIIKIRITDLNLSVRIICRLMLWYYFIKERFIKLLGIIIVLILISILILKFL